MLGIGIDTGGTYTDAVIYDMDRKKVLSAAKALTTKQELEIGISNVLDKLDAKLLSEVRVVALSTTLATNASLEDKGSRAKQIMIGLNPECMNNTAEVYGKYGMRDLDQLVFLKGRPEGIFSEPEEPDWEELKAKAETWFRACRAVGITQIYPRSDGGKLERKTKQVLKEILPELSVTTSYDLFEEVDVLKRGAGAFLNARLIPLIDEFLKAVKHVMADRGLGSVPLTIVRSDGSLMSEQMAREFPVETLLSGPAASTCGGRVLSGEEDSLIVDMGGTTTDIALVWKGHPLFASKGISIGPWKTTIAGLYVDTFLLGGDSAVRYAKQECYLDGRRVISLSVLSKAYDTVIPQLEELLENRKTHTRPLYEFYVLQKMPADFGAYTREEKKICQILKEGPLLIGTLASRMETDIYYLKTERLEEEGVVMRAGLTPTDMMVIKGDFTGFDTKAAELAIRFVSENTGYSKEEIPDVVYDLVQKKMYCNIARILLEQEHPKGERVIRSEEMDTFINWAYETAKKDQINWVKAPILTDLPIVGVGAPIHVFLPKVAALLGTRAVICENAGVANALGAIAGQIVTRVSFHIKARYDGPMLIGFTIHKGTQEVLYVEYEDAEREALQILTEMAMEKARKQGAGENAILTIDKKEILAGGLAYETVLEAVVRDEFHDVC